jgi:hypothetical protein
MYSVATFQDQDAVIMRDLFEDRENESGREILQAPRAWCVLNQNDMVASSPVGTIITGFGAPSLGYRFAG